MAANPILENRGARILHFNTHNISSREIESRRMGWGERKTQFTPALLPSPVNNVRYQETIFNAVRAPLSQGRRLEKTAPPYGPLPLFNSPLSLPFRDFSPVSHLYSRPRRLCPATLHGQPKNLLRISSRSEQGGEDRPLKVVTFWGIWRPPPAWRRRRRRGEDGGAWERPAGLCPGTLAQSTPPPKAMTVLRPARRGSYGAVVTSVRPPAPPTTPEPPNKHWSCSRPAHSCPGEPRLKAHAPAPGAPVCAGSVRGAGPWD